MGTKNPNKQQKRDTYENFFGQWCRGKKTSKFLRNSKKILSINNSIFSKQKSTVVIATWDFQQAEKRTLSD